jgi:hypothetical protein
MGTRDAWFLYLTPFLFPLSVDGEGARGRGQISLYEKGEVTNFQRQTAGKLKTPSSDSSRGFM